MKKYIKELTIILIVLAPAIYLEIKWDLLPTEIITFANNGEIDYSQSKLSLLWLLVLNFGFYLLMFLAPKVKNRDQEIINRYYNIRLIASIFVTAVISYFVVTATLAYPRSINVVFFFVGFLYTILGNYWPTIRSNRWFGYSTPETRESPNVWRKTHRASGRLMMGFGILLMILFLKLNIFLLVTLMSLMSLTLMGFAHIYSYYALKKEYSLSEKAHTLNHDKSDQFESRLVKTNHWDRSGTRILIMILFVISMSSLQFIPELMGYFNINIENALTIKRILSIINSFGFFAILLSLGRFTTVGQIVLADNFIEIKRPQNEIKLNVNELSSIYLEYMGYSKNWNAWGFGGKNRLEIIDKQNIRHFIKFTLDSKKDKLNLIAQLRALKKIGVKVEYNSHTWLNDDFAGLRERY